MSFTGSEKKPVGSVQAGKDASMIDLLGEEPQQAANGTPAVPNSTQDLLASLFGGSDTPAASAGSPAPAAAPTQRDIAKDILGLFDSPSPAPAAAASPPPPAVSAMQSIFNTAAATPPAPTPAPAPAPAAPAGLLAYDQNELRVTLAPQASPTRPGLVRIVASFQATGAGAVSGLNFQAAVPKVR